MKTKLFMFLSLLAFVVFSFLPGATASNHTGAAQQQCCVEQAACCAADAECCAPQVSTGSQAAKGEPQANSCCTEGAACCTAGAECCG